MSLWRTTSCWALIICCFCNNLHDLCDIDDHGDEKMSDQGPAHLAYLLLTVCCPWRYEMRLFRKWLLIPWFPFILSSVFSTFLQHISHMSPFDSAKRLNKALTVFKVHFFFGFLVFLCSESYTFPQYIFPVSPYNFAIQHSFGNYDLSSRFIKQTVYVL